MHAIRVIYDGKSFVPQQPVTLAEHSEAIVFVEQSDPAAKTQLDAVARDYYRQLPDGDDEACGNVIAQDSATAWDEA